MSLYLSSYFSDMAGNDKILNNFFINCLFSKWVPPCGWPARNQAFQTTLYTVLAQSFQLQISDVCFSFLLFRKEETIVVSSLADGFADINDFTV